VIYSDELDVDKYESWMTMLLVKITDSKVQGVHGTSIFSSDEICKSSRPSWKI
jgi:hypothetical protein